MKLLLLNFLEAGKSVITLDVEHEQWELCQALGGCFADIIEGTYKINLLEPRCWDTDADPYDVDAPKAFRQSTRLAQHTSKMCFAPTRTLGQHKSIRLKLC